MEKCLPKLVAKGWKAYEYDLGKNKDSTMNKSVLRIAKLDVQFRSCLHFLEANVLIPCWLCVNCFYFIYEEYHSLVRIIEIVCSWSSWENQPLLKERGSNIKPIVKL